MCPSCHSNDVSRSHKRKLKDRFMRWMGKVAYRCRECHRRFYVTLDVHERLKRHSEWRKRSEGHASTADQLAAETVAGKRMPSHHHNDEEDDPLDGYEEDFED